MSTSQRENGNDDTLAMAYVQLSSSHAPGRTPTYHDVRMTYEQETYIPVPICGIWHVLASIVDTGQLYGHCTRQKQMSRIGGNPTTSSRGSSASIRMRSAQTRSPWSRPPLTMIPRTKPPMTISSAHGPHGPGPRCHFQYAR